MELKNGEQFLIEVIRAFDFLRAIGYQGSGFNTVGREFFVEYSNIKKSRYIIIVYTESGALEIYIERNQFMGKERKNIKDFRQYLKCSDSIKRCAQLIHDKYMNVINGKEWV